MVHESSKCAKSPVQQISYYQLQIPFPPRLKHHNTHKALSMADVSYFRDDDDNDEGQDVLVSFSQWPDDLDGFDVYTPDLDIPSSEDLFCARRCGLDRNSSLDRETQANFVIDMFHQRVEQSQSQQQLHSMSRLSEENHRLVRSDRNSGVVEGNEDGNSNEFEVDFGSELGFHVENHDDNHNPSGRGVDDDYSGFTVADTGDEMFVSRRRIGRSESSRSSIDSGAPEFFMGGLTVTDIVSDSFESGGGEVENGPDMDRVRDYDDETSLHLCWDSFHLDDDNTTPNPNSNINGDFDWEEVDEHERIDGRELSMFFGAEADDDASVLPGIPPRNHESHQEEEEDRDGSDWEVLLNAQNFEQYPDVSGEYDEYNYTEYEMFFGQFADSDVSSLGRPPASKKAVENLSTVVISEEDIEKNNTTLCAVCKDEISVGEMAKLLPCNHRYHGDCIVPWLEIRNTCPVCRHELPTDDADYERRKLERSVGVH
ncbi:unnamed protein product [Lactuca virosa]|uniref:RING-type E3 ubiquitin transferase n=1 Tax=Lactuca virosa TaxID=75947 RepID=A0AAU9MKC4_9ASTR|nr:unnamed protein product [Lactuca virosa]